MDKLLAGRHLLIVEDEMLVLMLIEDMLEDLGCTSMATAATVEQALELIGSHDFDAAMLDMNLNGDRTHAVADALAAKGVRFIFATGYAGPDMRDGYADRPILTKPYQAYQLAAILAQFFAPEPVSAA
ncbi:MAG: response regulator [Sphingomonadaceae bacterium]|nr:response regulator [Sphingomonadaceae bacterium]